MKSIGFRRTVSQHMVCVLRCVRHPEPSLLRGTDAPPPSPASPFPPVITTLPSVSGAFFSSKSRHLFHPGPPLSQLRVCSKFVSLSGSLESTRERDHVARVSL